MNSLLLRSGNDKEKDNYKIILLLIIFLLFRIFYNFNNGLYIIFKPILFYIIYYGILFLFNKKNDSYYMILSLIISFLVPINTSLYIFIIGSIIGNIISYNNLILDNYINIYSYIYMVLCLGSVIYLMYNKLIKVRLLLSLLISILIIYVTNYIVMDNLLFILLFVILDNRYTPVSRKGQLIGGFLYGILFYIFDYLLLFKYGIFLAIFSFELLTIIINYLSIKLYNNRVLKYIFSV